MFLRYNTRKKDGKQHRYWSVVENRRLRAGHTLQRTVLYLGEINDTQQAAWRKSLEVLNEATQRTEQICLFLEDRGISTAKPSSAGVHFKGRSNPSIVTAACAEGRTPLITIGREGQADRIA